MDAMSEKPKSKWFDQYYGWLNYGPIQVTTGKWCSRYGDELKDDSGNWENPDFARYHVGVIGGKYGDDVDNLTRVYKQKAGEGAAAWWNQVIDSDNDEQKVSTAVAYTARPNDGTYFMVKGVAVQNDWGSTLRMGGDERAYSDYSKDTGGDLFFQSGFAAEVAYHIDNSFDFNFVAKSLKRDELVLGAFVRPVIGDMKVLVGATYGTSLEKMEDYKNYNEFAVDFRLIKKMNEALKLTTMHNISVYTDGKPSSQDYTDRLAHMWNMVSFGYKANEQVLLQLTVENECNLFLSKNDGKGSSEMDGPRTLGGFNISIIPGVTYSFNENASLTAGLKWDVNNVGANSTWEEAQGATEVVSSKFAIPVVFKVSL